MISIWKSLGLTQKIIICSTMIAAFVLTIVGSVVYSKSDQVAGLIILVIAISLFLLTSIIWIFIDAINKKRNK